jgi:tetratricopeptide (TPR) repeat protein
MSEQQQELLNKDSTEALTIANGWKDEGNEAFRLQQYQDASAAYSAAIDALSDLYPPPPPKKIPRAAPTEKDVPDTELDSAAESSAPHEETKLEVAPEPEDIPEVLSPEVLQICEVYSICHANRAACHLKLQDFADAEKDCTTALERKPAYSKALMRRAEACEQLGLSAIARGEHVEASGKLQTAVDDLRQVLVVDPSFERAARATLGRLEPLLAEEQEKMKEEMMGKLKDMGNWLLGKVGLSLNNFQTTKDPTTGNLNIQFVQKPDQP